jgi:CBS domain-containing protein
MATIYDLVQGREVYFVDAAHTVLTAARWMVERNIGAVPVVEGGKLVGIFSERDIMKRVVTEGRDPATTLVRDVMTPNPLVVAPAEKLENCMILMKQHGFRHLPIWDGQTLLGLVSLRDLLLRDLTEKDDEVRHMRAYIHASYGES